jgi:hypothetical protein
MAIFVVITPVTVDGWSGAAAAEAPIFVLITLLAIWLTYIGSARSPCGRSGSPRYNSVRRVPCWAARCPC